MNKKNKEHQIVKDQKWEIGRYTIVELIDSSGIKGIGLSRKSQLDRFNNKALSLKIAKGRALKSISLNKEKRLEHHTLMG